MFLLLACTATVPSTEPPAGTETPPDPVAQDTGLEQVPGVDKGTEGSVVFDDSVLHVLEIEIDNASWTSLSIDPRTYTDVDFVLSDGTELRIGARLKGNTQFRAIDDKPSFVLDFNRYVEDQHWDGLRSVYLHNMTYDPSNLHEHLAYLFFRQVGVPASRSSYATLTVNGQDYGIYLLLEKQNGLFNERWFGQSKGGTWEAGSFNHPCDLDDEGCDCWELDEEGDGQALLDLCAAAQETDFIGATQDMLDWEQLITQFTAEMAIAHYDNYGWNINNYRVHHVPDTGRFHWTPWSTDLAFGWYPWESNPSCGSWGWIPADHSTGYLTERCWGDEACTELLYAGLLQRADELEEQDLVTVMQQRLELIDEASAQDERSWYNEAQREGELQCMEAWIEARPQWLRDWVELRGG